MIVIKNHKIDKETSKIDFSFEESPNHSGLFGENMPDTIVIHYTAGGSAASSANWLKNKDAQASAHVVVGRKGEVIQLVPFNKIAWHAGKSEWKGRKNLNRFSIGIEIANAGILEKRANGYYTYFGKKVDEENVVLAKHKHGTEEMAWEAYTEKQIEIVDNLCKVLKEEYKISEIVGHEDIAPKRKTDPGPAFSMKRLRELILFGRKEENEVELELELEESGKIKGIVTADYLNIRNAPNLNAETVAEPLQYGTRLDILKLEDKWVKVKLITEGWVSRKYIKYFE